MNHRGLFRMSQTSCRMHNKEKYFKEVYSNSKDKVYRLCLGFAGNSSDADDLFQEVLIKVWKNLEQFKNESAIDTWIYKIATNTALLSLKRQQRKREQVASLPVNDTYTILETTDSPTNNMKVKKLYQAIATLKEIDRIIISLVLENCSYEEIATITGLRNFRIFISSRNRHL